MAFLEGLSSVGLPGDLPEPDSYASLGQGLLIYVALRTLTEGELLGTYNRSIREAQRVKGLRSKLSPKE